MIAITLPDGSQKHFDQSVSVFEIAQSISMSLAKAALVGRVNGTLVDLDHKIQCDASVSIITEKDPEGLDVLRHSTAHLLAHAVKILFPDVQVTIGPVIENGFYYDFAFHRTFTPEDLNAIENKMKELAKKNSPVSRSIMSREQAITFLKIEVNIIKFKLLKVFQEMNRLAFISKMISLIYVVVRTFLLQVS